MFLSNGAMASASGQVREIAAAMGAAVTEMGTPQGWTGADSDRFQQEWEDLVHARLFAACNKLDGISFEEITDLLNG